MSVFSNITRFLGYGQPAQPAQPAQPVVRLLGKNKAGGTDVSATILSFLDDQSLVAANTAFRHRDEAGNLQPSISRKERILTSMLNGNFTHRQFEEAVRELSAEFTSKQPVRLDLHASQINDVDLELMFSARDGDGQLVARFPNMKSLDLSGSKVFTHNGLANLRWTSHLKVLDLSGCTQVRANGLAHLSNVRELESLDLSNNIWITDADIVQIVANCPNLRNLNVSGCRGITNVALQTIAQLEHLEELNVSGTRVSDAGLAHLSGKPSLQSLDTSGCNVSDAGIRHVATLTNLRKLRLNNCTVITDIDALTESLFRLEQLEMSGCVEIRNFDRLARLTNLHTLDASGCQISKSLPRIIPYLQELQKLSLRKCGLKDWHCAALARLTQLQDLDLSENTQKTWSNRSGRLETDRENSVTDKAFDHLNRLKFLRSLNVSGCEAVGMTGEQIGGKCKSLRRVSARGLWTNLRDRAAQQPPAARNREICAMVGKHKAEIVAATGVALATIGWYFSQQV